MSVSSPHPCPHRRRCRHRVETENEARKGNLQIGIYMFHATFITEKDDTSDDDDNNNNNNNNTLMNSNPTKCVISNLTIIYRTQSTTTFSS